MKKGNHLWLILFGILVAAMCIFQSVRENNFHGQKAFLNSVHKSEADLLIKFNHQQ